MREISNCMNDVVLMFYAHVQVNYTIITVYIHVHIKLARIRLHYMYCVHKLYVSYSPQRTPSGQLMSSFNATSVRVHPPTVSNIQIKGTAQLLYTWHMLD